MKKKALGAVLGVLSLSLVSGDFSPVQAKDKEPEYPACSRRISVAVDRFKTENIVLPEEVVLNSREVLVDELVNSGCFNVLERENYSIAPAGAMNERALARSREGQRGSRVARKRQMKIAENLVSCALTGASRNDEGLNVGGLGGGRGGFGGLGGGFKKSSLSLSCKIFNTATSEILGSARVTTGGTSFNIDAGGGGFGGNNGGLGNIGYFKKSKFGDMITKAIRKAVVQMANAVAR